MSTRASNEISHVAVDADSLCARTWDRSHPDGCDALELVDLVAIAIGDEITDRRERARELLDSHDLTDLSRATCAHLAHAQSLPFAAALRLAAAFALGRRVESHARRPRAAVNSPARMHELLAGDLRGLAVETFMVLLLDGKHRLLRRHRASQGTLTSSLVHPREVFGPALREGAAAVAVAHNHPSGDPEPSSEDLAVTRRLIEAGRLVGVPLLDHLVVADARYVSIRERINFESV